MKTHILILPDATQYPVDLNSGSGAFITDDPINGLSKQVMNGPAGNPFYSTDCLQLLISVGTLTLQPQWTTGG